MRRRAKKEEDDERRRLEEELAKHQVRRYFPTAIPMSECRVVRCSDRCIGCHGVHRV